MSPTIITVNEEIGFHPGYYIQEIIDNKNTSIEDFANKANIDVNTLNRILQGNQAVTEETAHCLSVATEMSTQMWLNLQSAYDKLLNKQNRKT